jgi:hypothetical protein
MRTLFVMLLVVVLGMGVMLAGCGPQKEASSQAAIEKSKSMATVEEKADYLIKQAETFMNSKDFQQAVEVAQYVLAEVDKESVKAKDLLEKAKAELEKAATDAIKNIGK